MSFIGNTPAESFTAASKQSFSGDDNTTQFTLTNTGTTNGVAVFVENVRQEPGTAYTVSGTTLTFTAAPVTGTNNIYVVNGGLRSTVGLPAGTSINATTGTFTGDVSTEGDVKLTTSSGGIYTITGTDTSSNRTLTLPDSSGTLSTSAGKVLQVVSQTYLGEESFTGNSQTETGYLSLTASITPSSSSNHILILGQIYMSHTIIYGGRSALRLYRDSTVIGNSTNTDGAYQAHAVAVGERYNYQIGLIPVHFKDTPGDTSAHTYKFTFYNPSGSNGTFYVNRSAVGDTAANQTVMVSSVTLMEIEG